MKRMIPFVLMLALLPAGQLMDQEHMHDADAEHMEGHDAAVKAIVPLFEMVKGYLIGSVEIMPEEKFEYRPTEEVRTFGEIIGHVAGAQYMFCGTVTGGTAQPPENFEARTTKAGLLEAIKMGFAACDEAYAIDDEAAMEEVQFFGSPMSRLQVLNFNVAHNWEHYGNLVVYFRANGMVPPSSMGGL